MGHYASEMGYYRSANDAQLAGFKGYEGEVCPVCGSKVGKSYEGYWKIHRDWHRNLGDWIEVE